jgi:RNA polymerase sigma-70 factor, ECF subfamily
MPESFYGCSTRLIKDTTMAIKEEKRIPDTELVRRFKRGSMEAFEQIVERHEAKVLNLAMRFTRNHEDAEEVLQDVFATVFRKIDGFEGKSAFSSWMYRITVNAAFMKLRKKKQRPTLSIEDLAPNVRQVIVDQEAIGTFGMRSDVASMNRELKATLEEAIQRLPEQYRAVFVLRDVNGLSNQEVSEILELSIPAVKSRLHRSRLMLRRKLQGYWNEFAADTGIKTSSMADTGANEYLI